MHALYDCLPVTKHTAILAKRRPYLKSNISIFSCAWVGMGVGKNINIMEGIMLTTHGLRKYHQILLFLLSLFLMTVVMGCATTGPTFSSMKNDVTTLSKEQSRIIFYRPHAFFGIAMKSDILLDGKKVGESRNATFFYVDVAPGKHQIRTSVVIYPGEQSGDIELRHNETKYVKTYIGGSAFVGRTNFEVVSPEQAKVDGIDNLVFIAEPLK